MWFSNIYFVGVMHQISVLNVLGKCQTIWTEILARINMKRTVLYHKISLVILLWNKSIVFQSFYLTHSTVSVLKKSLISVANCIMTRDNGARTIKQKCNKNWLVFSYYCWQLFSFLHLISFINLRTQKISLLEWALKIGSD